MILLAAVLDELREIVDHVDPSLRILLLIFHAVRTSSRDDVKNVIFHLSNSNQMNRLGLITTIHHQHGEQGLPSMHSVGWKQTIRFHL